MKLNIGAGATSIEGFEPLDIKSGTDARDLSKFADNSVDEIRASHVLEHFDFADARKALHEWVRVLKPDGRIRIAVPDAEKCIALRGRDPLWRHYLMGGQTDSHDYHKSTWDRESLAAYMTDAGLAKIQTWESDGKDTSAHKVSLNLEGVKDLSAPFAAEFSAPAGKRLKVNACLSCPRIGWNDFWGEAVAAFGAHNIPIRRFSGAFWGQCLQNCLEDMIAEGVDLAITLDYDSVFTAADVDRLITRVMENDEIDALAALQVKRASQFALMNISGKTSMPVIRGDSPPIRCHTAHFGLTAIRLDALKEIPKPWFRGQPGSTGSYRDDDRLDEDIWFWHQWRLHGRTCFVDPTIKIGHLEVMVTEFDETLKVQHVHVHEWQARKKRPRTTAEAAK